LGGRYWKSWFSPWKAPRSCFKGRDQCFPTFFFRGPFLRDNAAFIFLLLFFISWLDRVVPVHRFCAPFKCVYDFPNRVQSPKFNGACRCFRPLGSLPDVGTVPFPRISTIPHSPPRLSPFLKLAATTFYSDFVSSVPRPTPCIFFHCYKRLSYFSAFSHD